MLADRQRDPVRTPKFFTAVSLIWALFLGLLMVLPDSEAPAFAAGSPESCRASDAGVTKNGHHSEPDIKVEPVFARKMYADFRAGYDAMYIAYQITNTTGATLTNAWITLDGWEASSVVSPASIRETEQRIPSLANKATTTKYFLVKASAYSEANQSHTVRVWTGGYRATESLTCTSTIEGVQRSISARANKITSIESTTPVLGGQMTITVAGAPGTVGQGSSPDNDIMTMSPTNYSSWPSGALRLSKVSATITTTQQKFDDCGVTNGGGLKEKDGNIRRVTFENLLVLKEFQKCASNKGAYTITYTFDVVGAPRTNPAIVPVSDISSGTQIKYTGGYPSTTEEVAFSDTTVPTSVSQATVTKDYVNGSAKFKPGDTTRLLLDYRITATLPSDPTPSLTLDELLDNAPPGATIVSSQIVDASNNNAVVADPPRFTDDTDDTETTSTPITAREGGTLNAPEIRFVGPFTLSQATPVVLDYTISVPVEANTTNTYLNSAFGLFGSYTVGSGTNEVGGISLTVPVDENLNLGTITEATVAKKLPQTITFTAPEKLGEGSSVTLGGYSDSGLPLSYAVGNSSTCVVTEFNGVSTLTMVGNSCDVTASQAGNDEFEAATPVTRTITPMPGQTISFQAPTLTGGTTSGTLEMSSTSLLEVEIQNLTPDECTATFLSFDATTTKVTSYTVTAEIGTGGACLLVASQPGNDALGAAPEVDITIGLGKLQRIVFLTSNATPFELPNPMTNPPPTTTVKSISYDGATGEVKASLPITLTSLTPGVCGITTTVSDGDIVSGYNSSTGETTTTVSLLSAGECIVQGDQDGFDDAGALSAFGAATPVTYTLTVLPSGTTEQTITLTNPGTKTYGDPTFAVQAESKAGDTTTGLLVTLSVTSGPCVIGASSITSGVSSAQVSLQGGGSCEIRATQGGDATYKPATAQTTTFTISPKGVTVTGLSIPNRKYDGTTAATFEGTSALSGVVPGDTTSQVALAGSPSAEFSDPKVGSETLTVTGFNLTGSKAATSYEITVLTLSGTITQRPITLTPLDQTIRAGSPAPASCTVDVGGDGLATGDDLGSPVCSYGSYTDQNTAATYTITLNSYSILRSGVSVASNYIITTNTGTLTTTVDAVLSITDDSDNALTNFTVVYGEGLPEAELSKPRAKKSAGADALQANGSFVHKVGSTVVTSTTNLAVGPHTLTIEFVADEGESATVNPTSRVVTVTKRPVTYTFTPPTKVYDGQETVPLSGFALASTGAPTSGVVSDDDLGVNAPAQGTLVDAAVGTHSLSWTPPTLTGAKAGNYELESPGAKTGEITKRPLTIQVASYARLVGQTNPTFTIGAVSTGGETGLVNSESKDDVLGSGQSVSVLSFTTDQVGSYGLRPEAPNLSNNYSLIKNNGTLYIASISIEVEETAGVLDSRVVECDCAGMLPNSEAVVTIFSTPTELARLAVGNDGNCTLTDVTIPDSSVVPDGPHTLEIAGVFPNNDPAVRTRAVRLGTPVNINNQEPPPGNNNPPPSSGPRSQPTPTTPPSSILSTPLRSRLLGPTLPTPEPQQGPRPVNPPAVVSPPQVGSTEAPRSLLPGLRLWGPNPVGGNQNAALPTIDVGLPPGQNTGTPGSGSVGTRSVQEISQEKLGGFQPGTTTILEILGTRTAARFVLTQASLVDNQVLRRAIEESIPTQAADFFALNRVQPVSEPVQPRVWQDSERDQITEVFAATGLDTPQNLNDMDLSGVTQWMLVEATSSTYAPGTEVFLVVTSEPIVIGSAVVDRNGEANLMGTIPVELLGLGEHRVRLVGIRALDGAFVESDGSVGLTPALLQEIQRFDLGTQSTIAIYGENPEGGQHVALRVVPLVPQAPWWTLWFILGAALIGVGLRFLPRDRTRARRASASALAVAALVPGVILGWLSTVVAVTWWSLGLGLVAAVLAALGPYRVRQGEFKHDSAT